MKNLMLNSIVHRKVAPRISFYFLFIGVLEI
jgi:hypothetical protein